MSTSYTCGSCEFLHWKLHSTVVGGSEAFCRYDGVGLNVPTSPSKTACENYKKKRECCLL